MFIFSFSFTIAQSNTADSLRNLLKTAKEDTAKVNTLKTLSDVLRKAGSYDSSMAYADRTLALAGKLGDKNGTAGALTVMGVIYRMQGNYAAALETDFKALAIYQNLGNKHGTATAMGNIGLVYWNQVNFAKALNYDFRALAIFQAIKEKSGVARILGNIGIIYSEQQNYAQALEFDRKSLEMDEELRNKIGVEANLGDIGNVYTTTHDYPHALEYDLKSLALARELNDLDGVSRNLSNIATIYTLEKNFRPAKLYFDSALSIHGNTERKQELKDLYYWRNSLDTSMGVYKDAYEDLKQYIVYKDSLVNEANVRRTVQAELNFEFEQKQATEKAEQDKKDAIVYSDKRKQQILTASISLGLLLVLVFSGMLFSRYRVTQKQKEIIEEQKFIVEEKNKEVLDSITYAKRLQDAILPPLEIIRKYLPESFVLYKPKDIVAGDFYWMERVGDAVLIAACDCTGHGVPGAMVSVVCSNALNRTVKEFHITEPGKILDNVRELVLETFEKSESDVQDGMDVSIASLTPSKEGIKVQWAGAFNSLCYFENGEMKEIIGDKQPVGKTDNPKPFTTHSFTLSSASGGLLYLFTDGYADQFGGPKGKKYKYKQLSDKLRVISDKTMDEQKRMLDEEFESWKGELEQVDDVLVMGIRV